jgi:chromosome partitioning protein
VVIAVVNNKGGVGKTTTSVNLAAAMATGPRHRILLIDLDSQCSASLWCGISRSRLTPSIADCLLHNYPLARAIRSTPTPNLDLVTGSVELANVDLALCDVPGREATLLHVLRGARERYEHVVLDCPPSLSLISVNALIAADGFIVPVTPQFLAVEGLVGLLASLGQVRTRLHARAELLGIVVTMFDGGRAATEARESLRTQYRERLFHTEIAASRALEDAPSQHQTIFQSAPRSRPADAYRRLAAELLQRMKQHRRSTQTGEGRPA